MDNSWMMGNWGTMPMNRQEPKPKKISHRNRYIPVVEKTWDIEDWVKPYAHYDRVIMDDLVSEGSLVTHDQIRQFCNLVTKE